MGIGDAEAKGASILDLASEAGSLLFEVQKFGPGRCVGVEGDGTTVALARRVAAFNGLNTVTFIDASDPAAMAAALTGPFDIVFCRVRSSPADADQPYGVLGRVTKRRLFIEGDEASTVADLKQRLNDYGFDTVNHVGNGDGRPLFVAVKS